MDAVISGSAVIGCAVVVNVETWLPITGFEGRYEVSNLGRVQSLLNGGRILKPAPQSKGYLCVQLYDGSSPKRPRSFCVHSLVAEAFIGPKPDGFTVDHEDRDKRNNSAANLRYATSQQNAANTDHQKRAPGRSAFRGVAKSPSGRWTAKIQDRGTTHIGTFDTEEEAALAYDRRALELFGEFARLNFPLTK